MVGRLLALLGVILVIVGVLKFVGILAIGGAAAGTLLVVGIVLILVSYFVLDGAGTGRSRL